MERALELLHPDLIAWCHAKGWTGLRPVQRLSVERLLGDREGEGARNIVISAATAGGKTEAAFLPAVSNMLAAHDADPRRTGFDILYVAPIKSLINDQAMRLSAMCEAAGLPVTPWHGDADWAAKQKAARQAGGIILITPESLEAMAMKRAFDLKRLFGNVLHVVVDEVHAFMDDPRGLQLLSILARIEDAIGRKLHRIGLSATLSDPDAAGTFLGGGNPGASVIKMPSDGKELLLGLKAFLDSEKGGPTALDMIAGDVFERLRGRRNLVFAGSRGIVELMTDRLSQMCRRERVPDEFVAHHGSLSKAHRHDAERRMRDDSLPATIFCTSTLELGIDIGPTETTGQIGPDQVSRLRQRLGRTGRREGRPAILRVWVALGRLGAGAHPADQLRLPLLRAVAMCELMLEGWLEPARAGSVDLSTLLHQILALICQKHGVAPRDAWRILCMEGPFRGCGQEDFKSLLRSMSRSALIAQSPEGDLLLGEKGEQLVGDRSFYAVFKTPLDWRIFADGNEIGTIPAEEQMMAPGLQIVLAGKRWKVASVDMQTREVVVVRSKSGKPPRFAGGAGAVHRDVVKRMRALLESERMPEFLNDIAADALTDARTAYRRLPDAAVQVIDAGDGVCILPWEGTVETNTLALRLLAESGFECGASFGFIDVKAADAQAVRREIARIGRGEGILDGQALAKQAGDLVRNKFDGWIDDMDLLARAYAATWLDAAWRPTIEEAREAPAPAPERMVPERMVPEAEGDLDAA